MPEYAPDLHQLWCGMAAVEYGKPTEFYRRTNLTEGLGKPIVNAAGRSSGAGGDPVVRLRSDFVEGRTPALIALEHLAGVAHVAGLPGMEDLLSGPGFHLLAGGVRRVVLVGHQLEPGAPRGSRMAPW